MKYCFQIASRVSELIPMEVKHSKTLQFLKNVEGAFGVDKYSNYSTPKLGIDVAAIVNLTKGFGKTVKGDVTYMSREKASDRHFFDDRIWVEFNSSKIDFAYLSDYVIYEYIEGFDAYRMNIYPEGLIGLKDQNLPFEIRSNLNYRFNIDFFYPIMYLDSIVIERALGYDTDSLYTRLIDKIYKVEKFYDGLLIKADFKYLSVEECLSFNNKMQEILGIQLPVGIIDIG